MHFINFIVVSGSRHFGPFITKAAARAWAEANITEAPWFVTALEKVYAKPSKD